MLDLAVVGEQGRRAPHCRCASDSTIGRTHETSKQLIGETRVPIPMKPGRPVRCDYEYERHGTANLFMMFAPLEGWRHVKVTDHQTAVDYAHVLKDLADRHFASPKTIVAVQDNLNIHGGIARAWRGTLRSCLMR
jgi:DDE superfamily endonuclease